MDLRNRSINNAEIETLFRDVLNQSQIANISNLLKLLGMYVFLDLQQLDVLATRHFGNKIGLSLYSEGNQVQACYRNAS